MKKFIVKICIFLLPLFVALGLPVAVLYKSGDAFRSMKSVIKNNGNYLIGLQYTQRNYHFLKLFDVASFPKRTVMALGSSRSLEFRDKMFHTSFYNAAFTIHGVSNFLSFMQNVKKDKYPDILIINVDQFHYAKIKSTVDAEDFSEGGKYTTDEKLTVKINTYFDVYTDYIFKPSALKTVLLNGDDRFFGLGAVMTHSGIRNDGSMCYASRVRRLMNNDTADGESGFSDAHRRIRDNFGKVFAYADSIDVKQVIYLRNFLKFCADNNIKVVAFLPPFADEVYDQMKASGKYAYVEAVYPALRPEFDKYGFEFYDFTRLAAIGGADSEMIDGLHGSESIYARILLGMTGRNSVLNAVCDTAKLKGELGRRINRYSVYGD